MEVYGQLQERKTRIPGHSSENPSQASTSQRETGVVHHMVLEVVLRMWYYKLITVGPEKQSGREKIKLKGVRNCNVMA